MDWTMIIPLVGILFGYIQFNNKLEQQALEFRLQLFEQQNKTYKELILAERLKRNDKMLESMKNMLSYLHKYSFVMVAKHINEYQRCNVEEKLQDHNDSIGNSVYGKLYEQVIQDDINQSVIMDECMLHINQEFNYLALALGDKFDSKCSDIHRRINSFFDIGYQLISADDEVYARLEKELFDLENELVQILREYVDEDWNDIEQQAKAMFLNDDKRITL